MITQSSGSQNRVVNQLTNAAGQTSTRATIKTNSNGGSPEWNHSSGSQSHPVLQRSCAAGQASHRGQTTHGHADSDRRGGSIFRQPTTHRTPYQERCRSTLRSDQVSDVIQSDIDPGDILPAAMAASPTKTLTLPVKLPPRPRMPRPSSRHASRWLHLPAATTLSTTMGRPPPVKPSLQPTPYRSP